MLHSQRRSLIRSLCPPLSQEGGHSGHLGPLPAGLCGWVWLTRGTTKTLHGRKREWWKYSFSAPSVLGCCVSGMYSSCLPGSLSLVLPLSGGSKASLSPSGLGLVTASHCCQSLGASISTDILFFF